MTITLPSPSTTVDADRPRRHRSSPRTGRIPAAEAERLFQEFFVTRDPELRERLVHAHLGLASSLASRFSSRQESTDDLHQAALLGLLNAVDRFDPTRGVQFTTFAWATISGELKRHFRDRTWGVRVPRRVQELYLVTAEAMDTLTNTLGRSPTVNEVAQHIGASDEEVVEALEARAAYRLASIDTPGHSGDGDGAGMQLGGDDPGFRLVDERSMLSSLINRLPERERHIIHLRFHEELTQAEISTRVGVSQMHVSRLLTTSLAKLRVWAAEREETMTA